MKHSVRSGPSLCVERVGARGPVVLFHHALGAASTMWELQRKALQDEFQLVFVEARGHGRSDPFHGPCSIHDLAEDVRDVVQTLELPPFVWVGCSLGGMVGMAFAQRYASHLRGMVLGNTSAYAAPAASWDERIALVEAKGMASVADLMRDRWFLPQTLQQDPVFVERVLADVRLADPLSYVPICRAIQSMDFRLDLPDVHVPALVIIGDQDPSTPPEMGAFLARALPDAEDVLLPARHFAHVDAVEAYHDALRAFMRRIF